MSKRTELRNARRAQWAVEFRVLRSAAGRRPALDRQTRRRIWRKEMRLK